MHWEIEIFMWLTWSWDLLYWNTLEPNPQYLWGVLVLGTRRTPPLAFASEVPGTALPDQWDRRLWGLKQWSLSWVWLSFSLIGFKTSGRQESSKEDGPDFGPICSVLLGSLHVCYLLCVKMDEFRKSPARDLPKARDKSFRLFPDATVCWLCKVVPNPCASHPVPCKGNLGDKGAC